jgi:hypothetical protein
LRDGDMLGPAVVGDQIGPGDIVVHRFDDIRPRVGEAPGQALKADNWPAPFSAWRDDVFGRVTGLRRTGRDAVHGAWV